MAESAVTNKGQITIPVDVRRAMGLKPQDRVIFTLLPDGSTVMRAKSRSLVELGGTLQRRGIRRTAIKDMRIGRR